MQKSVRRARKKAKALPRTRQIARRARPIDNPVARDERGLVQRIVDTPHLAQAVRHLQAELLHRIIQTCGLEDCGDLVALATPGQLQRVFDLDLWRPAKPGMDELLDSDRFAVWLDVLMESGAAAAAQKLLGIDADLVIAALAQHVLVSDRAAVSSLTIDGELVAQDDSRNDRLHCEIGNYRIEAKRSDGWSTIVDLLLFMDAQHPDGFHRLMRGCRRLSNSTPEVDGLDHLLTDKEQDVFDLAIDREERREQQGYVTPGQARAFLDSARQLQLSLDAPPPASPLARAYFRGLEWTTESAPPPASQETADAIAAVVAVLADAGVLPKQPRALLDAPQTDVPRLARIQTYMEFVRDLDAAAYSMRTAELAYLANAIVAGCSIQARPFTPREASDAAAAVCNLGLENWPIQWRSEKPRSTIDAGAALDEDFLVDRDLIGVFQVGWTVLHRDVCMYAAERLLHILSELQTPDGETQSGLDALRLAMARQWRAGAPWRAREELEVILFLDKPAWAALLGLIDECPTIHAAVGRSRGSSTAAFSAASFEFISDNRQIATVREFMESLPETLRA